MKKKASPNIIILNNKTLSKNIPSINHFGKRNFDFKKDILIKEIIGNENILTESNNRFKSLYNLDDNNNLEIELIGDTIKKNIIPNSNSSLMSKSNLKKNFFNKKERPLNEYKNGNSKKKFKRKHSLNINKLKFFDNDYNYNFYNTPKSHIKNRSKIITLNSNEKNINVSQNNYALTNIYNNLNKSQIKFNTHYDKKNISKFIFKNNSNFTQQKLKELKDKKIEKIIQLMNSNNSPSLNVNILRKEKKENFTSILSNLSNRNKKIFTLQNNLNFNDIINNDNKNHKNKLIFKMSTYKKEKNDYNDKNDIDYYNIINNEENGNNYINNMKSKCKNKDAKARCTTRDNFYRKSQYNFSDLNISTDFTSRENKNKAKSRSKKKEKYASLDSSNMIINTDIQNNDIYEKLNNNNESKRRQNWVNYKLLLNDVQKRMSLLINNLFNYIELLKKDK